MYLLIHFHCSLGYVFLYFDWIKTITIIIIFIYNTVLLLEIFIDYHSNDIPVQSLFEGLVNPSQPSDIKKKKSLYWQT